MGLPATAPADLVVTRLDAEVAGLTAGENLFVGPILAGDAGGTLPAEAVFVQVGSGAVDRQMNGKTLRSPVVQVVTRSPGVAAVQTLARAALAALDGWRPGTGGYIDCISLQPEPVAMGLDADGNNRLSFNVQLRWGE